MGQNSPAAVLYDASGNLIATAPGAAVPTSGLPVMGSDGANARYLLVDSGGRPLVKVTDGTNVLPTMDVAARAAFQKLTDGTNTAAVKAASTAAVATDPALVVAISPNNPITVGGVADVTATGALGALNANVSIVLAGTAGAGMQLSAGTLIGTIVPEISLDGGTTWVTGYFLDPITGVAASSIVFASSNGATTKTNISTGGASNVRIRVSAYTSGTANCSLRATTADTSSKAILGTDGTVLRTVLLDSLGRIITAPAGAASSSAGFVLGTVVTTATTLTALRASTYNEQSVNAQRSISSANAADAAAGTGARQVVITYYDSTGAGPSTETVTLNGTTPVNTVSLTICFIESIVVTSVGSGGSNAGILTLFIGTAGGGGTLATINATDNQNFWAHHYVATGKSCYITDISGNNTNSSNGSVISARSRGIPIANKPEVVVSDLVRVGGGAVQSTRTYGTPIKVTGPARVILYSACEGSPSITTRGAFDFYDQ